ncbi:MAG: orotidine-5'-phosphate decarboxylase [Thermoplasmata archaeon]|nr:orotidine-5'-phosphate decarboxylase [Thermoplasmata archaeon]
MPATFQSRVDRILKARNSLLCVGLDPDPAQFPRAFRSGSKVAATRKFLDGIVRATYPFAAAYKMQLACFLSLGAEGLDLLARLTRRVGPTRLRILDLKANDIGNTMRFYHHAAFHELGFDAVTVTPWLGWETLEAFQEDSAHGFFVVAHSSNPGAPDFQEIPTPRGPLWQAVVAEAKHFSQKHHNGGVVVGATYADAVRLARQALGNEFPILVPGVGAQGGALSTTVREGVDARGRALLINSSRGILYASRGPDWASAARAEAERLAGQINQLRAGLRTT